jgi:hypothetical protein
MTKRLAIWAAETALQVALLGVVLGVLLGHDQSAFAKDVVIYGSGIFLMFFTTGYLLTTIIARAFWKGKSVWLYSCIAVTLYFLHFEIMNMGLGGAFEPADRFRIRIAGAVVFFICTFVGTILLRRWTVASSDSGLSKR